MEFLENEASFMAVLTHQQKVQIAKFKTSDAAEIFRLYLDVL
jgi:hypothetical protein